MLGKLLLHYTDGQETTVAMDASWKAANQLQTSWQLPGFNDSSWVAALVLGSYGMSPWTTQVTIQTRLPIFRRQFAVRPGPTRGAIVSCTLFRGIFHA